MKAVILSGGFSVLQRPVFIITGIIVARGLSVKREQEFGGRKVADADCGYKTTSTLSDRFTTDNVIFAYQLLKVKLKDQDEIMHTRSLTP